MSDQFGGGPHDISSDTDAASDARIEQAANSWLRNENAKLRTSLAAAEQRVRELERQRAESLVARDRLEAHARLMEGSARKHGEVERNALKRMNEALALASEREARILELEARLWSIESAAVDGAWDYILETDENLTHAELKTHVSEYLRNLAEALSTTEDKEKTG